MVVRIGMIGAGFIARLHATALRSLGPDAAQIVGVAARRERPREAFASRIRHSGHLRRLPTAVGACGRGCR